MSIIEKIKKDIISDVNGVLGEDLAEEKDLVYPPDRAMGDLSLPCFSLAQKAGKNPAKLASELLAGMKNEYAISVKTVGPYLNFVLDKKKIFSEILNPSKPPKSPLSGGLSDNAPLTRGDGGFDKKRKIMVEYSNVNTHKEYHVGHLRNLCFGDAVCRLLKTRGDEVFPVSYINDFGIHTAKTLWAFKEFYNNREPKDKKGYFLGKTYVKASQELKENKAGQASVAFLMKKIESREGDEYEMWQKTREWSIEGFERIYAEMKTLPFTKVFYESDFIDKGREMIKDWIDKGILKESQGAIIADLEKYDLGILVVVRSDGTALYPVADLPLALEKIKKYDLDESVYVVDIRQGLYFKQLFKLLELSGRDEKMLHLGYDFVKLPEGMMSSRSGNVITYDELRKEIFERFKAEAKKRHQDWSEEKLNRNAEVLTNAIIKFEMLKISPTQSITFKIDEALRAEGFTAVYLEYSYVRIQSILKKADLGESVEVENDIALDEEGDLIVKLIKYPEVVSRAVSEYDPSELARYLFELAQVFNDYYHKTSILKSEENLKIIRLALIKKVAETLKDGLGILGIEVVEEM